MGKPSATGWRALANPVNISRRGFVSALGGIGALVLAPQAARAAAFSRADGHAGAPRFSAMLSIGTDGTVTFVCPSSEMGQGTQEALARIVAEELDCDWNRMRVVLPWAQEEFNNPVFRRQLTADSRTITGYYASLRKTGAAARAMLIEAAAKRMDLPPSALIARMGMVIHEESGRSLAYGVLAQEAAALPVPDHPPLKSPAEFELIGSASKRLDLLPKVTGTAEFGIDVHEEGMLTATLALGPHPAAKVEASGLDEARNSPGVVAVVPVTGGYAVVADRFWRARKAAEKISLNVVSSPMAGLDDAAISERLQATLSDVEGIGFPILDLDRSPPGVLKTEKGPVLAAIAGSARAVEASYEVPYLAHATMEPPCCAVRFTENGGLYVRGPLQAPGDVRKLLSDMAGVPLEQVRVEVTYLGGGFGRKWSNDFAIVAMEVAKALPGRLVKTVYTREQDMAADEYRPACAVRSVAGLDESGAITAMHSRIAGQSINSYHKRPGIPGLHDMTIAGLLIYDAYDFPNKYIEFHESQNLPVPVGFWRSVALSQNAFFHESFIDEIAHETGKDPYRMRRDLLARDARFVAVLDKAAEMIGWDDDRPSGTGRGIAVSYTGNSYCAQAVEVSVNGAELSIHKIVCAVDCGLQIDPASVEGQVSGGMIFGLQAALWGGVHFEDGRVTTANFSDYRMPLLSDLPTIEVALISGSDEPGPVGETATPTIAPAIANAIVDAGGPRIRRLPISRELQI